MNTSARLLCVFVAVVFVRSAAGDMESDANCTMVPEEGKSMYETFRWRMDHCGYTHGYTKPKNNATEAEIRAEIVPYCARQAEHRECYDTLTSQATHCLDENQKLLLRLNGDNKFQSYEAACAHNGEDLVYVLTKTPQLQDNFLTRCIENARATVNAQHVADINGELIHEYKISKKNRECLRDLKGKTQHDALIDMVIAIDTQVLDTMKCNHEGNAVLCKTIVD